MQAADAKDHQHQIKEAFPLSEQTRLITCSTSAAWKGYRGDIIAMLPLRGAPQSEYMQVPDGALQILQDVWAHSEGEGKRKRFAGRDNVHVVDHGRTNDFIDLDSSQLSSLQDLKALNSLRRPSKKRT